MKKNLGMLKEKENKIKQKSKKIKYLSVAKLFAKAIRNAHEHESISSLFIQTTK